MTRGRGPDESSVETEVTRREIPPSAHNRPASSRQPAEQDIETETSDGAKGQPTRGFPPGWDRYDEVAFLGDGGMGEVYKAWDPQLRRHVALKFLARRKPRAAERFLAEAQAQARVSHPSGSRTVGSGPRSIDRARARREDARACRGSGRTDHVYAHGADPSASLSRRVARGERPRGDGRSGGRGRSGREAPRDRSRRRRHAPSAQTLALGRARATTKDLAARRDAATRARTELAAALDANRFLEREAKPLIAEAETLAR